jgi:hypothetical protein
MSHIKTQYIPFFLFFLALSVTVWAYWPGLYGPFLLDDFNSLQPLSDLGGVTTVDNAIAFIFSNNIVRLGRPVSMASFLLSDQHGLGDAFLFKYHNLLFHLLSGVLLFYLTLKIFSLKVATSHSALWLATFVASLWLLHPYNISTTLYVVQRMTQLAAVFSIAAMILFLVGRQRLSLGLDGGFRYLVCSIFIFVPLSVLSKENGILTLVFLVLFETILFSPLANNKIYRLFYWVCIVFPLFVLAVYFSTRWAGFMRNYDYRNFSLMERLLTETRILFSYIYHILVPQNYGTGLVHDDIVISKSFFQPITTLFSTLGILVTLILAWVLRRRAIFISLGVLFFFTAHLLESSFIPLELYFEHRNYLAMFGILIALAYGLYCLAMLDSKLGKLAAFFIAGIYLFSATMLTHQSAKTWNNSFDLLTIWATEHPDSLRAQRIYGQLLGNYPEWYLEGNRLLEKTSVKFPNDITLPMLMLINACKNDKELPISINNVIKLSSEAYPHNEVVPIAKKFSNLFINGPCSDGNSELGHILIHKLEELSGMIGLNRADLLYHHATLYADQENYGVAVNMLKEAYKYQKVWLIPYTQAVYAVSGGMYTDALMYIDTALLMESNRKKSTLSQKEKIISLRDSILTRKTLIENER